MNANPIGPTKPGKSAASGPEPPPKDEQAPAPSGDAGTDESIAERLARNPESREAQLDRALDESMDASDPPASVQPVHRHRIPDSSGDDAAAEARHQWGRRKGVIGRLLARLGLEHFHVDR